MTFIRNHSKSNRLYWKQTLVPTAWIMVLTLIGIFGCVSEDEACDPGWMIQGYYCVPSPDSGISESGGAQLGEACEKSEECSEQASLCMNNPTSPDPGYCTIAECTVNPNDCPEGYHCCDLSIMSSSLPTACLNETDYQALSTMLGC